MGTKIITGDSKEYIARRKHNDHMKKLDRQPIREILLDFGDYNYEYKDWWSLDYLIDKLIHIQAKESVRFDEVTLEIVGEYDCARLAIVGIKQESEESYQKRLASEKEKELKSILAQEEALNKRKLELGL